MSNTDICNKALSLIGGRATIDSLSDGSEDAAACAIWYDSLRKMLLRAAHWGFARAQDPLTLLGDWTNNGVPYPWPYKYQYPNGCLKVRYMLPPTPPQTNAVIVGPGIQTSWCTPSRSNPFIIANDRNALNQQSRVVLATLQQAQAVYTIDVVDTDLMDDLFQVALANMIAYHIVIQLTGNAGEKADYKASTEAAVNAARASDANEAMPRIDVLPDWLAIRGTGDLNYAGIPGAMWFAPWDELGWSG